MKRNLLLAATLGPERRPVKVALVIAAALALGGCNFVGAEKPLFTAADATGASSLKAGVWSVETPCPGDNGGTVICNDKPQILVTVGELRVIQIDEVRGAPQRPAEPFDGPVSYVLAAGKPRILQGSIVSPADADTPAKTMFLFMALVPTAQDASGRIIAGETWPIVCGPKDSKTTALAGLTMNPDGSCAPADRAAVRAAAQPSRAWSDGPATIKWVKAAP